VVRTVHETWTIGQWQKSFRSTYGHRNQKAGPVYVWLRMLEEIGEVVQSVRYYRTTQQTLVLALPDIFAWLCAFCDVTGVSLEDAVWEQYQSCPYCFRIRSCDCGANPLGTPRLRRRRENAVPPRPLLRFSLTDWEKRLDQLYGERNNTLQPIDLIARLTDHAGRLAKALRKGASRHDLAPLAADVFAWMIAVWNAQRSAAQSELPSFAELVARKYDGRCPACVQSRCTCSELVRMFVSSSMVDDGARELRAAARATLAEMGLQSTGFEDAPLNFEYNQQVEALRLLAAADGMLLILDRAPSAAVREEIDVAIAQRKPIWVAVRREDGKVSEELAPFVERLQRLLFTEHFSSVADLPDAIRRLGNHRLEEHAGEIAAHA